MPYILSFFIPPAFGWEEHFGGNSVEWRLFSPEIYMSDWYPKTRNESNVFFPFSKFSRDAKSVSWRGLQFN